MAEKSIHDITIEPELREGYDEVERAAKNTLPALVTEKDIKGELHAHSLKRRK